MKKAKTNRVVHMKACPKIYNAWFSVLKESLNKKLKAHYQTNNIISLSNLAYMCNLLPPQIIIIMGKHFKNIS